jgi:hypothetical protein
MTPPFSLFLRVFHRAPIFMQKILFVCVEALFSLTTIMCAILFRLIN